MAAFGAVWLIWGSSFAATKVMVEHLPPILAVSIRAVLAGLILFVVASWRGSSLPATRREWQHVVVMAVAAVVLSTLLNTLAAAHIASNEVALLNASAAFFIVIFGSLGPSGAPLGKRSWGSILLGFGGVALLLLPHGTGQDSPVGWMLLVLLACIGWGLGTAYFRHHRPVTEPLMFNALQLAVGGLLLAPAAWLTGERWHPEWTVESVLALGYLTVFSSCIGYSAFTYLMARVTPAQLGTYAYVNPLVATLMGWWLLGESLSVLQWLGGLIVLASVAVINLPADRR
jgi:drug/metabolite transporter (DMT)-like permease